MDIACVHNYLNIIHERKYSSLKIIFILFLRTSAVKNFLLFYVGALCDEQVFCITNFHHFLCAHEQFSEKGKFFTVLQLECSFENFQRHKTAKFLFTRILSFSTRWSALL